MGAEAALTELASLEPPQPRAFAESMRLYIETERLDEARGLLNGMPEAARRDALVAAAAAALENAERASALDEVDALRRRAAADPEDTQARFDLALALNAKGLRDDAAAALLRHRPARP